MISQKEIFLSRGYNVPNFYLDADGRKVEIETREDEEQSFRLDGIIKMLVGAGYYRAKIKGISPFDIVVGGMAWCLDSGDIDLDVDLLFEEGLSIGQKIALTEKIVVVLPKIKCPYFIEPHEIQGLNFIQIYPVIEWLINWSQENREKQALYLKEYARNQYHKNFINSRGMELHQSQQNTLEYTQNMMELNQPKRIAKQTNKSLKNIKSKLASTMAEYGLSLPEGEHQLSISQSLSTQDFSEKRLNFEDVFHLSSDYHSFDIRRKLNQLHKELETLKQQEEKLIPELQKEKEKENELKALLEQADVDIENFTSDEKRTILDIQELINGYEILREEERSKKASFKQELSDLQASIHELENYNNKEEIDQLEKQLEKFQKVLTHKKLELAEIARKVTSKERMLERIPSRAELSQYQKRYLELYRIHTLKTAEAKQNIMTYNMLDNRLKYIKKQANIVNSIQDNYSNVLMNGLNHDTFFEQIEEIIGGVLKAKESIVISKTKTDETKQKLITKLKKLQNQKTEYAKAIDTLNTLYERRYETLSKLEELNVSIAHLRVAVESNENESVTANSTTQSNETISTVFDSTSDEKIGVIDDSM